MASNAEENEIAENEAEKQREEVCELIRTGCGHQIWGLHSILTILEERYLSDEEDLLKCGNLKHLLSCFVEEVL